MAQARTGDTVKVNYTGKLNDGTVFDTTTGRSPLEFTIGEGHLIPDFEQAVIGMAPGESKSVQIASENAYGPRRDEMVMTVERKDLPEGLEPQVNQKLQVQQPNNQPFVVTVTEVSEESITLDANHPLAGKDLTFDIHLAEIASLYQSCLCHPALPRTPCFAYNRYLIVSLAAGAEVRRHANKCVSAASGAHRLDS
jgi:peptidylprolyl isomerase